MKDLIIFLYQSYLLYRYEQQGIIYTKEYCKITKQYYGSILNLNNGVRIDVSNNIKSEHLFRKLLIIEIKKEQQKNGKKVTRIQKISSQRTELQKTG